jgi:LPXTG-motif cell wall-anchored protein
MSNRSLLLGGTLVGAIALASTGTAKADSTIGVCAFTGSTPPYQFVLVNQSDLSNYESTHLHDIYNVSNAADCPSTIQAVKGDGTPSPTPTPSLSPTPTPAGTVLSANTSLPTELPDTGAGLSTLIGLPTVIAAGSAYVGARRFRR